MLQLTVFAPVPQAISFYVILSRSNLIVSARYNWPFDLLQRNEIKTNLVIWIALAGPVIFW